MQNITIVRKLPIINGAVAVPDGGLKSRGQVTIVEAQAVIPTDFPGHSAIVRFNGDRGAPRSPTTGQYIKLPAYATVPAADYYQTLRDAV